MSKVVHRYFLMLLKSRKMKLGKHHTSQKILTLDRNCATKYVIMSESTYFSSVFSSMK